MKIVLFCGGLGTRIREYSEGIPKPMIPIGHQPILWHVMQYYSQYGHRDFILCLGYKAHVIKDYFLNLKPTTYKDCIISDFGRTVKVIGEPAPEWRITLVDTGISNNIGERLMAVKRFVENKDIFLAIYSDGLTVVNFVGLLHTKSLRRGGVRIPKNCATKSISGILRPRVLAWARSRVIDPSAVSAPPLHRGHAHDAGTSQSPSKLQRP